MPKPPVRERKLTATYCRDDKMVIALFELVYLEVNGMYECDMGDVYEWYYAKECDKDFANSTYSDKQGRDQVAYSRTESFRKKLNRSDKLLTKNFLEDLLCKLTVFKEASSWLQFVKIFEPKVDQCIDYYYPILVEQYNKYERKYSPPKIEAACIRLGFRFLYRVKISVRKVYSPQFQALLAAIGKERQVVYLSTVKQFGQYERFMNFDEDCLRMLYYDKKSIAKSKLFGLFFAGDEFGMSDAIALIPLTESGHFHLWTGKLFTSFHKVTSFPRNYLSYLPNHFICDRNQASKVDCIYIDCGSRQLPPEIDEVDLFLEDLVKQVMGSSFNSEILLYIANDSPLKRRLITQFGMKKIPRDYSYLIPKSKGESDGFILEKIDLSLYCVKLSDIKQNFVDKSKLV